MLRTRSTHDRDTRVVDARHESRPSVVSRVFAILGSYDPKHRRQSLTSMARRTGLPLTTVHRLVHDLETHGALIRGSDGDYEMGSRIWRFGILASVHAELREVALPYMEDVYEFSRGAVQIVVPDGLRCLVVERIAGSRTMAVLSKPGTRLPLHATGVGKVLLAFGERDLHEAVFDALERYTPQTITDAGELRRQLREIVAQGFAQTSEELHPGATSIAVPVRGRSGATVAALGVVSPKGSSHLPALARVLHVTSAALSRKLISAGWE